MPWAIALIMFGIGINLKFKDFTRVFLRPKAILIGLAGQFILLPALGFLLAWLLPIDPLYKVGIVLIASAPGGTASNIVTNMLKGRVALSVSLTSLNSFGILLTIPLYVGFAVDLFLHQHPEIQIGFRDTFLEILYTVVLPVIGGVLLNEYGPHERLQKLQQPLRYILPGILLLVFTLAIFGGKEGEGPDLLGNYKLVFPLLLFNALTMYLGFRIARIAGVKHDGAYTIAVEMGLQNAALAIFIATQVLNSPEISLVALLYSSFTFFTTWLFAWLLKHYFQGLHGRVL